MLGAGASLVVLGLTLVLTGWFFRAVGRIPGPDSSDPSLTLTERIGAGYGEAAPLLGPYLLLIGAVLLAVGLVLIVATSLL